MEVRETCKPAFTEPPGAVLAGIPVEGLDLPIPWISYGRPYYESCAKHIKEAFHASRVYIIASGSLARKTNNVAKLVDALGKENVDGVREGMTWSEILSITAICRKRKADCVVTIGAGSITDGAKLVVFVPSRDGIRPLITPVPRQRHQRP